MKDSDAFCNRAEACQALDDIPQNRDIKETIGDIINARYGRRDVLLSGYLEGEHVIADQPAVVEARVAAGRVILFGFRPQYRAQSLATYPLLFNAISAR